MSSEGCVVITENKEEIKKNIITIKYKGLSLYYTSLINSTILYNESHKERILTLYNINII